MQTWKSPVIKGKIDPVTAKYIGAAIARYEGKTVEVSVEEWQQKVTDKQLRHYFGYIVPAVEDWYRSNGDVYSKKQIHTILMNDVGKYTEAIVLPDGRVIEDRVSARTLTTKQWNEYLELLRQWGAENGVFIPLPNEKEV